MLNDFAQKLKNLPKDAQDYLISMKSAELNGLICNKHGIKGDLIGKHTDLIIQIFFKEIKLSDLVKKIIEIFGFSEKNAKELAIDIAGIRLLIIKDWLGDDIANFIKSLGGNPNDYLKFIDEQKMAIKEEKEYFEKELAEDEPFVFKPKEVIIPKQKRYDLNKEREDSIEIFRSSLFDLLSYGDKIFLEDYNLVLLQLLEDPRFKKDLENAIFANQEKLTGKDFVLDGKRQMPTIANWLKDFIKKNGSGAVDNLALSQYVAASENAKKLDNNEKKLLHKLLLLYRNLKIFPQNLEKVPEDEWEIFPLADDEKPVRKNIKIGGEDERVVELRNLLEQYEPGSIERRAIEEELRKLA